MLREKLKLANEEESLSLGIGATTQCKKLCDQVAKQCATKHFSSPEGEKRLRTELETAGISSTARKAHVCLSILLQALATRDISVGAEDLMIQ